MVKVLVADDNNDFAERVAESLEAHGITAYVVGPCMIHEVPWLLNSATFDAAVIDADHVNLEAVAWCSDRCLFTTARMAPPQSTGIGVAWVTKSCTMSALSERVLGIVQVQ
jgi:hypothetical protein